MDKLNVTIDGRAHQVPPEYTILQAAEEMGIEIPTLCHLKDLAPEGACRMCLVEVEGNRKGLVTACTQPCAEGMVVHTGTEQVRESRRFVLDMLLSTHNKDCFSCAKIGVCKLQQYCFEYGVEESTFSGGILPERPEKDDTNPFFTYDPTKCILCRRCQRTCDKIQGRSIISIAERGFNSTITTSFEHPLETTACESCGNCVAACPTGALTSKDNQRYYRSWEVERVRTTCPHCGTGCQMDLLVRNGKVVGSEPAPGPANRGILCVKGRFGSYKFIQSGDRLTHPLIKENGEFRRASWEEAIALIGTKMKAIQKENGDDCVAGFSCSRSPNEDNFIFQKMMRAVFHTNNVDNCARVCHSASVHGLAITLGSGAMTNPIRDITESPEVVLLIGSNPTEAHPVVGAQIRQAVNRGAKLIVVDPRRIDLVDRAELHLQIKAGTNVAFSNGMVHIFLRDGLADMAYIADRTEGFDELSAIVADYTPEKVGEICGINPDDLVKAAHMYAKAEKAPIIYCLGVTEHSTGTEGVMSMSNIAMTVGKLGKAGCGVNPLRGQNNVQGACDMGCMPYHFPGYQKVEDQPIREKFEKAWGVKLSDTIGLMSTQVMPAAAEGTIKGLYIFGEDPVETDANSAHVREALGNLEFLVVQDLFMTETAKYADVILPGISYAEKEGTFTNTERRVQRVRKAVTLQGEMRPDTEIFYDVMEAMGYKCEHLDPAGIMDEIASLTPSFGGISYARLDAEGGLQWPCPTRDHPGTPILHVGKFTRGLGYFYPVHYRAAAELPDAEFPVTMITGRMLYHYNARSMTGRTDGLNEICDSSYIEISSEDAQRIGVSDGEMIRVASRRGEICTIARVGKRVQEGEVFMTFHFPDGNVNELTNSVTDDIARIYEYKVCAVKLAKA